MRLGVCPAHAAAAFAARLDPSHLVTFASPGSPSPAREGVGATARLDLAFNDVVAGVVVASGDRLTPPDRAMMERLLRFAAGWTGEAPMLLCCYAGISRSPAAAYAIACSRSAPGSEAAVALALRAASPSATPNALVVALADDILGRGGRMIAAIEAIGRGAEAFEGEPFGLDVADHDQDSLVHSSPHSPG
jgi:predicted protein tyrosine phosphatase